MHFIFRPAPQSALRLPLQLKRRYPQLESGDYSCGVAPKAGGEPPPITPLSPLRFIYTKPAAVWYWLNRNITSLPCQISSTCIIDRLAYGPSRAKVLPLKWLSLGQVFFFFFKWDHTKSRLNVLPSYKAHKNTSVIVEVFDFRPTAFNVLYILPICE